jgi:5-oxoprolinase (ATP-hydrolysing) subunit C
VIRITRAGPLCTLQDGGRFGLLASGVTASGPMDRGGYHAAGAILGKAGATAIEFTAAGLAFEVTRPLRIGFGGGGFRFAVNGKVRAWPGKAALKAGDRVDVTPGAWGNYGYLRFDRDIDVPPVLGSKSTNLTVHLGGVGGQALKAGDELALGDLGDEVAPVSRARDDGPIRVVWGVHADLFAAGVREAFVTKPFGISPKLDRMGARLDDRAGVFAAPASLSLVSEAIVAGDIQILGDGTPIVLLRDHQPTGGYPRIATVISADLDRFVQLRPGSEVRFQSVTLARAQELLR